MERELVFVSGFGPFEEVTDNPSGRLARALAELVLEDARIAGAELPVSFARGPEAFDRALADLGERPAAVLALGVHRGSGFRLERRARATSRPGRLDADGEQGDGQGSAPVRTTDVDVERVAERLREHGVETSVSEDAGGYVCERLYRHALDRRSADGPPVLFVHVPHAHHVPLERQRAALAVVVRELVRQARELKRPAR